MLWILKERSQWEYAAPNIILIQVSTFENIIENGALYHDISKGAIME